MYCESGCIECTCRYTVNPATLNAPADVLENLSVLLGVYPEVEKLIWFLEKLPYSLSFSYRVTAQLLCFIDTEMQAPGRLQQET